MTQIRRAPVTIVVLTGDERRGGRDLLARLEPSLVAGDNAVLVGPQHHPGTLASWREHRGSGGLTRARSIPSLRELVVVLDDRVTASDGLLELLVGASSDKRIGVVAPRSNVADGDELLVGVPYAPSDVAARRAYLRDISASASGARTTIVEHLDGPCLLVRRALLEAAGGVEAFGAAANLHALTRHAREAGLALAVCEGAYVHHPGGAPRCPAPEALRRPFVSACLIVRDEAHQLAACLASANGVADEIVVYDTGSTDGTVDLARSLGATVIEGHWDDDFARARNVALSHCRGQWIAWLDADELLECEDRPALRTLLAESSSEIEGYLVQIDNLRGTEASTMVTHSAVRLFRRACAHWDGRLHEQIVPSGRDDESALARQQLARITHRGYLQSALSDRDKVARNLRNAFGDLAGGSELDWGTRILSLGRSYLLAGRFEEGITLCRKAADLSVHPTARRLAYRALVEGLLSLHRPGEALEVVAELREHSAVPALADLLEGRAHLELGEYEAALAAFERIGHVIDEDSFEYQPHLVAAERATALRFLERSDEAAEVLLASLRESGGLDSHLGLLVEALDEADRDPAEIHDQLEPERVIAFVPQLLQLEPTAADRVLEAWFGRDPSSRPILAAAAEVSLRLPIPRQLIWSARLRSSGLPASCPLIGASASYELPPRQRALTAAVAWSSFGDERALQNFAASVLMLERGGRDELRCDLAVLAPQLVSELEMLPLPSGASTHRSIPELGQAVLVIARHVADPRSLAVATELARCGYEVVLAHPEPTHSSRGLLAERGVLVVGWNEAMNRPWHEACLAAVARLYATRTIDAVVLGADTASLRNDIARLLPAATILDDRHLAWPVPVASNAELDPLAIVPWFSRHGICVVASLRGASVEATTRVVDLAGRLAAALRAVPFCHLGDDPEHRLARALPGLVDVGAIADPTPWLRAARGLVVLADEEGAWTELALACGTPVVAVTAHEDLGSAVEQITRLCAAQEHDLASAGRGTVEQHRDAQPALIGRGRPRSTSSPSRARRSGRVRIRLTAELTGSSELVQENHDLARSLSQPFTSFDLHVVGARSGPEPGETSGLEAKRLSSRHPEVPADLVLVRAVAPRLQAIPEARLVVLLTFNREGLPAEWIGALRDLSEECWVTSTSARRAAIESGLAEERVHVVPLGVNRDCFHPGDSGAGRVERSTTFLFAGPLSAASGIDALLESWLTAEEVRDNACLVIRPLPDPFAAPEASSLEHTVRRVAAAPSSNIRIIDGPLAPEGAAALYRSCDVLVHPARADGSYRVVAEAMACGLPVVAVDGTICDELLDEENGWIVASNRVYAPAPRWTATDAGFYWREPSRVSLTEALQRAASDEIGRRRRAGAASRRIEQRFALCHTAEAAAERIAALLSQVAAAPGCSEVRQIPVSVNR